MPSPTSASGTSTCRPRRNVSGQRSTKLRRRRQPSETMPPAGWRVRAGGAVAPARAARPPGNAARLPARRARVFPPVRVPGAPCAEGTVHGLAGDASTGKAGRRPAAAFGGIANAEGDVEGDTVKVTMTVNGRETSADVEDRLLLVHYLRDVAGLTATNVGCDTTSCGACTVLMDGESVKSCTVLAAQADGREITTVEGLAGEAGEMHPVQRAFQENHGLQCGFCTPGMVMAIVSLLRENPHPTEEQVRAGLEGNLCRCTGYHNIVRAALAAASTAEGASA